ncbi:MAG: type II toxin-antitoxin system RelE/ParE family toxin [Nitrospirota bacterium]
MRILWTEGAVGNLDEIETYIAKDKPGAAVETVIRIIEAVEILAEHPSAGRPGRLDGTRELIIPGMPYIVPYRVRDQAIEVLRVFHHARKWPEKL